MLRTLALLALAAPVLVEEPPERIVDEIAELRERVGGAVVGDREDFAEALKNVAERSGFAQVQDGLRQRRDAFPSYPSDDRQLSIDPAWDGRNPSLSLPAAPIPDGLAPTRNSYSPPPRDAFRPHPPRPPQRPTKVLLRESAFQLERIAHELEMSELCDEADSLRDTAGKLRKSARGSDAPKQATRKKKSKLDIARHWVEQEQAAERQQKELREIREMAEELRKRASRRTEPEDDREAQALKQGLKDRRLDLIAPPPGVHGGPHEPPKPDKG